MFLDKLLNVITEGQQILIGNNMENRFYTIEKGQQILIRLLKESGIKKVIVSPGTTNITFVASLQHDSFFELYSSPDERSACYMACGMAFESGEPVVLTCTGATASRNYIPGLTEAYYRKLPILAVTSLLGYEKIGHLRPQIIDRRVIGNDVVKCSYHIPMITDDDDYWNAVVKLNEALLELRRDGGGPVHIDLETRCSKDFSVKKLPDVNIIKRYSYIDELPNINYKKIGIFVGAHKIWAEEETKSLERFCECHNAIVLCDNTSNYLGKYKFLSALLTGQLNRDPSYLDFDLIIHIGEVSGDYYTLGIKPKEVWRVSEDGIIKDYFHRLSAVFQMPEKYFFNKYSEGSQIKTLSLYESYNSYKLKLLDNLPDLPFSNIWAASIIAPQIPDFSEVHLGILHSLRSWNFFEFKKNVTSISNVGGFGIDGCVSTLIGSSQINKDKLYFGIFGDLAFFYDLNSLGNRHVGNNLRIILFNNGKGTEFKNFDHPGHIFGDETDKFIAAGGHYGQQSRGLIKHYVQDLGFIYFSASNKEELLNVVNEFVNPEIKQSILIEVFTNSKEESDSDFLIRNILPKQEVKEPRTSSIKGIAKKVIGDKGIRIIKILKE